MTADAPPALELLAIAVEAAREAGALLLQMRRAGGLEVSTKSTATDMVTSADRASERLIVERILQSRPDDAILGEEGGERLAANGSRVRWVLDPLDGTTNYLYHQPFFNVSIGIELDGEAYAGVVFDPSFDELFTATRGGGAFLNGEPIHVSGETNLAAALIATGFHYQSEIRAAQGIAVAYLVSRVRDIRRHGASALDLSWVACGRVEAYFERGLSLWDMAAGGLIVRESGGVTSAIEGGRAVPGSMLAAPPALLEPLRALIRAGEALAAKG